MDKKFEDLLKQKKEIEDKISKYKEKCPHNKGIFNSGRDAVCNRCFKVLGRHCEKSKDGICKYKKDEWESPMYNHAKCICCGLLYED